MGFILGIERWFNIHKMLRYVIWTKQRKNHMIISINAGKNCQNSTLINEKNSQHNEATDKPTANIILNSKKLKAFPLRSGTRQGCPLILWLLNMVLEVLATVYFYCLFFLLDFVHIVLSQISSYFWLCAIYIVPFKK